MAGSVFKRYGCTDAPGTPLGQDCPRFKKSDHGSWYYKAELPVGPNGRRHLARKGGYATKRAAHQALVDLLDRVNKRTHLEADRETLAAYLERWLAGKRGLRSTSQRSYEATSVSTWSPDSGTCGSGECRSRTSRNSMRLCENSEQPRKARPC